MRNLTLGTLIVAGGLLAALPFRRASMPTSADDPNRLATGPTSSLTVSNQPAWPDAATASTLAGGQAGGGQAGGGHVATDRLGEPAAPPWHGDIGSGGRYPAVAADHGGAGRLERSADRRDLSVGTAVGPDSPVGQAYAADRLWPQAIPSAARTRPRRSPMLPLTFEDLAVPLESPHYTDRRFDAVAPASSGPSGPAESGADHLATNELPAESGPPRESTALDSSDRPASRFDPPDRFREFNLAPQSEPNGTAASSMSGTSRWSDGNASRSILQSPDADRQSALASSDGGLTAEAPRSSGRQVSGRLTGRSPAAPTAALQGLPGDRPRKEASEQTAVEQVAEPMVEPVVERQRHWIRQPG